MSLSLVVRCTWLPTVGDRAFPIASARLWNSLPSHVTTAPSLSTFHCRFKSQLFSLCCPSLWFSFLLFSARTVTCHFEHCNRFDIYIFNGIQENAQIYQDFALWHWQCACSGGSNFSEVINCLYFYLIDHVDDPKLWTTRLTGWRLVLFLAVGAIAVFVCAMIGYIIYSHTNDQSRKRLFWLAHNTCNCFWLIDWLINWLRLTELIADAVCYSVYVLMRCRLFHFIWQMQLPCCVLQPMDYFVSCFMERWPPSSLFYFTRVDDDLLIGCMLMAMHL